MSHFYLIEFIYQRRIVAWPIKHNYFGLNVALIPIENA